MGENKMTDTAMGLLRESFKYVENALLTQAWNKEGHAEAYDLRARITALLDSGGWVKVGDGLPEAGVSVLVCEPGYPVMKTCHDGYEFLLPHKDKVTHWQPLPPLPKG